MTDNKACPECGGRGQRQVDYDGTSEQCKFCSGTGIVTITEKPDTRFIQVIEEHDNFIRLYEIEDFHLGDDDDPLTTIKLTGNYDTIPLDGKSK